MLNINDLFQKQKTTDINWVTEFKQKSFADFLERGLPHKKIEQWKYVNFDYINNIYLTESDNTKLIDTLEIEKFILDAKYNLIVLIDGIYQENLSSFDAHDAITICPLNYALKNFTDEVAPYFKNPSRATTPFASINNSFLHDGVYIHIKNNYHLQEPIHILYLSSENKNNLFLNPYNLIVLKKNCGAQIIEHYAATDNNNNVYNVFNNIILNDDSQLLHHAIINSADDTVHINNTNISAQKNSHYENFSFALNGKFIRVDLNNNFYQKNGRAKLYGLYTGNKKRYVDYHTYINHHAVECMAEEFYKGIIEDNATVTFNGNITVSPHAQKTQAILKNKNLLLDKRATINTKPELEIYADDVKCNHGATVGQLDDMSITYLRARGIDTLKAQELLIFAFTNEIIEKLSDKAIKDYLSKYLMDEAPC